MKTFLGAAALVLALAAGAGVRWWVGGAGADGFTAPAGGPLPRPDFTLPDLASGKARAISEWDGKRIVLNFWASWCAPCLEEMPMFVELQERFGPAGAQFVGVAVDSPENARRLAERLALNYPNLVGELEAMDAASAYGNRNGVLPFTVLINEKGQIEATHDGLVDRAALEAWLAGS